MLKLLLRDCTSYNSEIVDYTDHRCSSDESVLMKAVFTYHAIFTEAQAAGNPELLYAVTARLLDMIMALICKCKTNLSIS